MSKYSLELICEAKQQILNLLQFEGDIFITDEAATKFLDYFRWLKEPDISEMQRKAHELFRDFC